jgi:hypothetical protein
VSVDNGDRLLQLGFRNRSQYPIKEGQHLSIRVRSTTEEDDTWPVSPLECEKSGIVEIGRNNYTSLLSGGVENLLIECAREPDRGGMDALMPGPPKMCNRIRRHGHVHEEPHPLNSMTSSSARLAA